MIRAVVFTINNPDGYTPEWNDTSMDYLCYAPQTGAKGTPHLQGMAIYKKKMRKATIEGFLTDGLGKRCFVQKMFGTPTQARSYIVDDKKKTNTGPHVEHGEIPEDYEDCKMTAREEFQLAETEVMDGTITNEDELMDKYRYMCATSKGKKEELMRMIAKIASQRPMELDIPLDDHCPLYLRMVKYILDPPDYRKYLWVQGEEVNTGKTTRMKWLFNTCTELKIKVVYCKTDQKYSINHLIQSDTAVFLLDIPKGSDIPYDLIESIRDGTLTSAKFHGDLCRRFPKDRRMIICSNTYPDVAKIAHDFVHVPWPAREDREERKTPRVGDTFVAPTFNRKRKEVS